MAYKYLFRFFTHIQLIEEFAVPVANLRLLKNYIKIQNYRMFSRIFVDLELALEKMIRVGIHRSRITTNRAQFAR